jgi:catechol 2,3-dioxygenase-like lactoylglutathione lyase family enzyme
VIDHTGLTVTDVVRSKAFYRAVLGPLGYALIMEWEQYAGFGVPPKPDFWNGQGKANVPPIHVAFRAQTWSEVDAFY